MPGRQFEAETIVVDDHAVIVMHGDVNRTAEEGLSRTYGESISGPTRLLLDFNDVDYINSTGIALIVGLLAKARASGREVGAFGLNDHYTELFNITRLSDFMTLYRDQSAAVGSEKEKTNG